MKYLIVFIIAFLSLGFGFFDPDPPQCINGIGHAIVKYDYSLRDTTGLDYSFDTVLVDENIIEWLIVPAGFDTLVFTCMRCDSIVKVPTDTMRILARFIEWDYEGVMTVGEDTENLITGFANNVSGIDDIGIMNPEFLYEDELDQISFFHEYDNLIVVSAECVYIYIDGIVYIPDGISDGSSFLAKETSPFPTVGDSCNVKIKLKE